MRRDGMLADRRMASTGIELCRFSSKRGDQLCRVANTFKSESEAFSQAPSGPALGAQLPKQLPAVKAATANPVKSLRTG